MVQFLPVLPVLPGPPGVRLAWQAEMRYCFAVSATEIIEQFRKLPDEEQVKVLRIACELVQQKTGAPKYANDAELQKEVAYVFSHYADLMRKLAS